MSSSFQSSIPVLHSPLGLSLRAVSRLLATRITKLGYYLSPEQLLIWAAEGPESMLAFISGACNTYPLPPEVEASARELVSTYDQLIAEVTILLTDEDQATSHEKSC